MYKIIDFFVNQIIDVDKEQSTISEINTISVAKKSLKHEGKLEAPMPT